MLANRYRFLRIAASVAAFSSLFSVAASAASVRSRNFVVHGPDPAVVRQVAQKAEELRDLIAQAWLGKPLPAWPKPCPIQLRITGGEAGGVTSFSFERGRVTDQDMTLEGSPERILNSALPHEITHTVFAWHFGEPMPRWADEGACMLSEDLRELARQDEIISGLVRRGGHMPLSTLFSMEEYPKDLLGFYGQGYSVSRFLIEIGGRELFLKFVADGSKNGWDISVRRHYNFPDTKELDRAWRSWYGVVASRRSPGEPHQESTLIAFRPDAGQSNDRTVVNREVIRGQSPGDSSQDATNSDRSPRTNLAPIRRRPE
jgi:hypothetical protein